jgi:hypothetical protein
MDGDGGADEIRRDVNFWTDRGRIIDYNRPFGSSPAEEGHAMDVDKILAELRAERDLIDQAIDRLQLILRLRSGGAAPSSGPVTDEANPGSADGHKARRARAGNES